MGVNKKTDGRYIVGMGAPNENEYRGSQGWRDIFIQLTENGATPDSEEKLAFLRDYAIYHNGEGNAIMPPSVSVWVSNNGVTSAVNADDISLDGSTYTICGIKWDGSSWDYSNAGQSSGGGSSLPSYTSSDVGKVLTVGERIETVVVVPEQDVTITGAVPGIPVVYGTGAVSGVNFSDLNDGDIVQLYSDGNPVLSTAYYSSGESGEGLYAHGKLILNDQVLYFTQNTTMRIKGTADKSVGLTTAWRTKNLYVTFTEDENGYVASETFDTLKSVAESDGAIIAECDGAVGVLKVSFDSSPYSIFGTLTKVEFSGEQQQYYLVLYDMQWNNVDGIDITRNTITLSA